MIIQPPHYGAYLPEFGGKAKPPVVNAVAVTHLFLPYPPSVNKLWATAPSHRGGYIRVKTKLYREWINAAGLMINGQRHKGAIHAHIGDITVNLIATQPKDKRRRDLDNIAKAALDALVEAKIIKDDSYVQDLHLAWDREWPDVGVRVAIKDCVEVTA